MSSPGVPRQTDRSRSVRRFYVVMAWLYDPLRRWWSRRTREAESELDSLFEKRIHLDSRILELGPGTGINLERLFRVSSEFRSYVGIDLSKEKLARGELRARGDARIQLQLGDVCDLSNVEGPFDFIVSTWLLSHVVQPEAVVASAIEKLAPGGSAVFLFGTAPRSAVVAALYRLVWRAGSARLVDPEPLRHLPGFERLQTFSAALGALATLIIYRAPSVGAQHERG